MRLRASLLVFFAAAAAFSPALENGWVPWDDERVVLNNPHIRSFSADNVRWMFGTASYGTFMPLAWLSFAADYRLWGLDARGYHLTSVLLHALNAVLGFLLILRLLELAAPPRAGPADSVLAAALGALLFALHPLRVEAVAWASDRSDLLGSGLYLAGLLAYLYGRPGRTAGLIALSATAKAVAITAPAVLLILDWYPLRRRGREIWLGKLPFFLIAALTAAVGLSGFRSTGAVMSWSGYDLPHRLAQAGHGLVFYLLKTAWPAGLSPLYEVPRRFQPWEPRFLLCWAAVAALTTLAWRARRSRPQWLASWACYVAVVAPMLGLSQSGRQFTADRYSYLACLPWAALAAGGWLSGAARRPRLRWALSLGAGSLLLALTLAAGRQIAVWRDGLSLWTRAVEIQPESPTSRINLGLALAQAGLPDGAARQFSAALSVNPNCAEQRRASFDAACQAAAAHLEIARKNSRGRSSR